MSAEENTLAGNGSLPFTVRLISVKGLTSKVQGDKTREVYFKDMPNAAMTIDLGLFDLDGNRLQQETVTNCVIDAFYASSENGDEKHSNDSFLTSSNAPELLLPIAPNTKKLVSILNKPTAQSTVSCKNSQVEELLIHFDATGHGQITLTFNDVSRNHGGKKFILELRINCGSYNELHVTGMISSINGDKAATGADSIIIYTPPIEVYSKKSDSKKGKITEQTNILSVNMKLKDEILKLKWEKQLFREKSAVHELLVLLLEKTRDFVNEFKSNGININVEAKSSDNYISSYVDW